MLCMCACPLVYAHTGKHRVVNIDEYMVYMYMYKCRCTYCTCIYLSTWEGKGNFPPISKRPQWLNSVCNFVYSFSLHVLLWGVSFDGYFSVCLWSPTTSEGKEAPLDPPWLGTVQLW